MGSEQKSTSEQINDIQRSLSDAEAGLRDLYKPEQAVKDNLSELATKVQQAASAISQAKSSLDHFSQLTSEKKGRRRSSDQSPGTLDPETEISRQRLLAVMEALPVGVAILDDKGGNIQSNHAFNDIWGSPRPQVNGVSGYAAYKAWWVDTNQPVQPGEWASAQAVQKGIPVSGQLMKIQRFDGTYIHVLNSAAPIFNPQGQITGCAVAIQDVSELKRREDEIAQLNYTLKALSGSNQAMMHASNETDFLNEVCRLLVEDCAFAMVWIGYLEHDEQQSVKPVASAGFDQGYLAALNISMADPVRSSGPTGTAIRTGKPARCNNMLTDPCFAPWREAAVERGYSSSIVLPLLADGQAFGAINLYSHEADGFSDKEEKLLVELAGDLAYGITTLRLRAESIRSAEALRRSEAQRQITEATKAERQRFFDVLETLPVMICLLTPDYHVAFANRQFRSTFGESNGRYCYECCYGREKPCNFCESYEVLKTGQPHHWEITREDGVVIDVYDAPFTDVDGTPMILEMDVDITERRREELELIQYRQHLEDLVKEHTANLEAANARLTYLASFPEDNPRPIVEVSLDGEVSYANPVAQRLFPDLMEAGAKHPWLSDWKTIKNNFRRTRAEVKVRDVLIGERYYQQSLNYIAAQGLIRIYGLDITERRLAEEALRKTRDELELRVNERTLELRTTNEQLRAEVAEREKAQTELESSLQELQVIEEELRNNNEMLIDSQKIQELERRRYQDLFEFAPDAYLVTDANGLVIEANQNANQLLGISHQNLIGKPLIVFIAQADHNAFTNLLASLHSRTSLVSQEFQLIPRQGPQITVSVRVAIAEGQHKAYTLRWTIRDISERKHAEETIRQNALRNAVLSEVSQSLAEASLDEQAVVDIVTKTTSRLVGDSCVITMISADEQWLEPVAWSHKKPEARELMSALYGTSHKPNLTGLSGRVFQVSKPLLIKEIPPADAQESIPPSYREYLDRVGVSSIIIVPIQINGKTIGTLGITRDTGSRPYTDEDQSMLEILAARTGQTIHNARLYHELQASLQKELETHDQLVQSEKFAAVGRLLASITHEINNPLQTIKNCLYLSQMDTQPGTPLFDALAIATTETNRLSNLVAQLREIYRPPTHGLSKPVDLPTLIDEVQVLLVSYMQDKHVLWVVTPPQDELFSKVTVEGVPDQLKQVFLNICLNAIDAMELKGGRLMIDFKVNAKDHQAGVCFRDTGPGLPPEVKTKLFEPFTTTKEKGLGLGLAICYDIIQKHNGTIEVESEPGQGAAFMIWLPARRE